MAALALVATVGCRDSKNGNTPTGDSGNTTGGDGGGTSGDGSTTGPAVETTVQKITAGEVAEGTRVILKDVVITAVDGYGQYTGDIYVQEGKGPGSGIKLFGSQRIDGGSLTDLVPGDRVRVEGQVKFFTPKDGFKDKDDPNRHIKELTDARITHLAAGNPPQPEVVSAEDLMNDDPPLAAGRACWSRSRTSASPARSTTQYGEFRVTGNLSVDDELYPGDPKLGDCLTVSGISMYFFFYKLNPRGADDLQASTGCPLPTKATIKDIQDPSATAHPKEGDQVVVEGTITAVDSTKSGSKSLYYGFWIQDGTGPYTGIYVFHSWDDQAAYQPKVGDQVEVTATYDEYYDVSELTKATIVKKGDGTAPAPEVDR